MTSVYLMGRSDSKRWLAGWHEEGSFKKVIVHIPSKRGKLKRRRGTK
jgi:hypothetical protein